MFQWSVFAQTCHIPDQKKDHITSRFTWRRTRTRGEWVDQEVKRRTCTTSVLHRVEIRFSLVGIRIFEGATTLFPCIYIMSICIYIMFPLRNQVPTLLHIPLLFQSPSWWVQVFDVVSHLGSGTCLKMGFPDMDRVIRKTKNN